MSASQHNKKSPHNLVSPTSPFSQKKNTPFAFSRLPSLNSPISRTTQPSLSTGVLNIGSKYSKVLIIQNDLLCSPCTAIASLIDHDIQYHVVYAFHDNAFKLCHPLMYEAIIVLGGRAGVYEDKEKQWLATEMSFLKNSLSLNIPIFGVCLGCQLLAKCIGGEVFPGEKGVEIGYKGWNFTNDLNNFYDELLDEMSNKTLIHSQSLKGLSVKNIGPSKSTTYLIKPFDFFDFNNNKNKNKLINKNENDNKTEKEEYDNDNDDDIDFNEDEFDVTDIDTDDDNDIDIDDIKTDTNINIKIETGDRFVDALNVEELYKYIILFHGDTFSLPQTCKVSGEKIHLLAVTNKYNTLFRVGQYTYGFQGHPELTYDMLSVWCKCWGDEFIGKWEGDIEKDVIEYAKKYQDKIKAVGRRIFDIWCKEVVLVKRHMKMKLLKTQSIRSVRNIYSLSPKAKLLYEPKIKPSYDDLDNIDELLNEIDTDIKSKTNKITNI